MPITVDLVCWKLVLIKRDEKLQNLKKNQPRSPEHACLFIPHQIIYLFTYGMSCRQTWKFAHRGDIRARNHGNQAFLREREEEHHNDIRAMH